MKSSPWPPTRTPPDRGARFGPLFFGKIQCRKNTVRNLRHVTIVVFRLDDQDAQFPGRLNSKEVAPQRPHDRGLHHERRFPDTRRRGYQAPALTAGAIACQARNHHWFRVDDELVERARVAAVSSVQRTN